MRRHLIRVPLAVGGLLSAVLFCLSLKAILTSDTRWDDYLIEAVGVLLGSVFVAFVFWLAGAAFFPTQTEHRSTRLKKVLFVAFVIVIGLVWKIIVSLDNMTLL